MDSTHIAFLPRWSLTSESQIVALVSVVLAACLLGYMRNWKNTKSQASKGRCLSEKPPVKKMKNPNEFVIEPLDFDWRTTDVVKQRPFKPLWHMTMAVKNVEPSELSQMDSQYLDRINLRKEIMSEIEDTVLVANERVQPAINEIYTWMMGVYLPTRFPTMFKIIKLAGQKGKHLENLVTGDIFLCDPPNPGPKGTEALKILGQTVKEDFLILLPNKDRTSYVLDGAVACFPSSWSPKQKHNMTMREIHVPVPRFNEKLVTSLDRFFLRLEPGKIVRRENWAFVNDNRMFAADGNFHAYDDREEQRPLENIDPQVMTMRSERQSVHKLPQSGAICFTFKSLMYPLADIKAEGHGEEICEAIDGMLKGSVPEIHQYKRAGTWAEPVKAYLRRS